MKSSINFLNQDKLFWFLIVFLFAIITWSLTFTLDKSINIEGEIKPLGKPLVVQSRFDGKIIEIHVKAGQSVKKGQSFITFETDIDQSELLQNETNIITTSVTIERLSSQLKRQSKFAYLERGALSQFFKSSVIDGIIDEQMQALFSELNGLENQLKLIESEKQVKRSEIEVHKSSLLAIESKLEISKRKFDLINKLFKKGYEGEIAVMEASAEVILAEKELNETLTKLSLSEDELIFLDDKFASAVGDFERNTIIQLNEQKEELRLLKIRKNGLEAKIKEFFVKSPEDGVLSKLMAENTGQVLSQGDTLA